MRFETPSSITDVRPFGGQGLAVREDVEPATSVPAEVAHDQVGGFLAAKVERVLEPRPMSPAAALEFAGVHTRSQCSLHLSVDVPAQ